MNNRKIEKKSALQFRLLGYLKYIMLDHRMNSSTTEMGIKKTKITKTKGQKS